ncbi:MAG: YhbY family RNA-binding protein [Oscillospiraceae bacterium]|jgi:RNA-binding protein|nr:YhbY family RNA-binding protein [Oscillospiraceae bacterium]
MLTSKQRAAMRKLANGYDAVVQIGKDGITDTLVKGVWDVLEARELIKVNVQETAPFESTREACDALCEKTHAEAVQVIGRKFVIFRESREPKVMKKISE